MASFVQDPTDPTGVKDLTPRGNSEVVSARQRKARAALSYRQAGISWDDIAKHLGFPTGNHALVATEKALEAELRTPESRIFMRQLAAERLDALLRSTWPKAINPDEPDHLLYNKRAADLIGDMRRLQGLDAPTQVVVSNPAQEELEKWVNTVLNTVQGTVVEADIFASLGSGTDASQAG